MSNYYDKFTLSDEFLEWYGKRQAELYMKLADLEDERLKTVRPPYWLIFVGAILGAVIGGLL